MDPGFFLMKYSAYHTKHIILCLFYIILCCLYQIHNFEARLIFTVFPLLSLYYGALSIPKLHRLYEYNTKEQTIPKFTYLWRAYYHIVMLNKMPYETLVSLFILVIICMWKDIIFLVDHGEQRLKAIDTAIYRNEMSRELRITNFHLNTFPEDFNNRKHNQMFHTNDLSVVRHTYESEDLQNGIKNYEEFRLKNIFPPKRKTKSEERMWQASAYKNVFVEHRDLFIYLPMVFVLLGLLALFILFDQTYLLHLSTILFTGDVISTALCTNVKNDLLIDVLYFLNSASLLIISVCVEYQ